VNIAASTGDMGILASHVPSVEPLRPGVLEVIESTGQSSKWFGLYSIPSFPRNITLLMKALITVSGGFAIVHPGSILTINAVEAASLDSFSLDVSTESQCRTNRLTGSELSNS
jgi:F-type H+-transporting ATPase subunit delta